MHALMLTSWYRNPYAPLSGLFFQDQAEAAHDAGAKIGLICVDMISIKQWLPACRLSFGKRTFHHKGIPHILMTAPKPPKLPGLNARIQARLQQLLFHQYLEEHGKPDIVHLQSVSSTGRFAMWLGSQGIPYIVTEHYTGFQRGEFPVCSKAWQICHHTFKHAARSLCVSQQLATFLEGHFDLPFQILPNLVDTDYFQLEERSKTKKQCFTFLNVAFLRQKKNQKALVQSFSKAFRDMPHVNLVIAGEGPEKKNIQREIDRLRMREQIKLFGQATRAQVRTLMCECDVFVLPSLAETFGVVLIEAMACGKPVLATSSGGPESIISDERLGILLADNRQETLTQGLRTIYEQSSKYQSDWIRQNTVERFSKKSIGRKLVQIYEEVLTTSHAPE